MIRDSRSLDFAPIDTWGLRYRLTGPRHGNFDPQTLATVRPLADATSERLAQEHDFDELACLARSNSLSPDWESRAIDLDDLNPTREWLRQRRPDTLDDVYVEWDFAEACAAVVRWDTFCNRFDDFWYPTDVVLVTDDSKEWQLLLTQNEFARWRTPVPPTPERPPRKKLATFLRESDANYRKYFEMKATGAGPEELSRAALADGASWLECIKALRTVFGMSFQDACRTIGIEPGPGKGQ